MLRKIIHIDKEKCNGCGLCASACHEGAIAMIDGKASLIRDDYCDGLGDCLPACPVDAITFVEREAKEYDPEAVRKHLEARSQPLTGGCPGSASRVITHLSEELPPAKAPASQLTQWPVQIKLAPVNAGYFEHASLLIAADCCAYAYGDFHNRFIKNHVTLIGCPKLDSTDYSEKLTAILKNNSIQSITVTRMEVPCCGGIESAVKMAIANCGKSIPSKVVTISIDGGIR